MVAKGHHYPNVTLVGILSADGGLSFPDFRAAERCFRLLSQAAGRTGRGTREGRVIIQTYAPDHFIYRHLVDHDYEGFAARELELRRELAYPPFGEIALLTVSSPTEDGSWTAGGLLGDAAASVIADSPLTVLGPTEALVKRLRGFYRVQVLVKGRLSDSTRSRLVRAAKKSLAGLRRIDLKWDFDPVSVG
jgi:primosomal protein N' (replication factor Y)